MSKIKNIVAGLGGAIALNLLHESLKRKDKDMPRVDVLGEEALQKSLNYFDMSITNEDTLYRATLAGDIISNALYYATIGNGGPQNVFPRALAYGLAAGVGAITLPEPLGLDEKPVTKTNKTKALTVGYYLFGALITAAIIKAVSKNESIK